jgi:hypothetical protein
MIPFLLAAAASSPVMATSQNMVVSKFDNVIVYAPIVESSSSAQPRALDFNLNGESRSVYFAAFSPSAIEQIVDERLVPQKFKDAKKIKFAPFSLSKFDALIAPSLNNDANSRVLYVPDPVQVPLAEALLIKQGADKIAAAKVAKEMPMVFCPQPAIKATPGSGPLKGQTFVPCSTDYKTVKSMIDKGIKTNTSLQESSLSVVAIPLRNFSSLLMKSKASDVDDYRILPNPVNFNFLKELREKNN